MLSLGERDPLEIGFEDVPDVLSDEASIAVHIASRHA